MLTGPLGKLSGLHSVRHVHPTFFPMGMNVHGSCKRPADSKTVEMDIETRGSWRRKGVLRGPQARWSRRSRAF